MWARIGQLVVLSAAAGVLGGCSAEAPWAVMQPQAKGARPGDAAAFEEAVALAANLRYERAAAAFERLLPRLEAAGDDRRAAEALFWLAFCREKQGRADQAEELYRRLIRGHPRSPAAGEARRRLAAMPGPG